MQVPGFDCIVSLDKLHLFNNFEFIAVMVLEVGCDHLGV